MATDTPDHLSTPTPAVKNRLASYLLAIGVQSSGAQDQLIAALEQVAQGEANTGPGLETLGIANTLGWLDTWQQRIAERVAQPTTPHDELSPSHADSARAAVRQWLNAHWGRLLSIYPQAPADAHAEAALVAHIRAELPTTAYPPVPLAHPQDMPRQPLGNLPAVLRSEFWGGTYRWILPLKYRQQRDRLNLEATKMTTG